jgi:hypothetical protein
LLLRGQYTQNHSKCPKTIQMRDDGSRRDMASM